MENTDSVREYILYPSPARMRNRVEPRRPVDVLPDSDRPVGVRGQLLIHVSHPEPGPGGCNLGRGAGFEKLCVPHCLDDNVRCSQCGRPHDNVAPTQVSPIDATIVVWTFVNIW